MPGTEVQVLLLDIGGVVIDIDPGRCFEHWGRAANVDPARIAARWLVDSAYEALEVGAMDFTEYAVALSRRLDVELPEADWLGGWNALLGGPIEAVASQLPLIAQRIPLYGFSNTNEVHEAEWSRDCTQALAPFRQIFSSWRLGLRKPDVAAYRRVAKELGVPPAGILFLDDNAENIRGARAAGLRAAHVPKPSDTLTILANQGLIEEISAP